MEFSSTPEEREEAISNCLDVISADYDDMVKLVARSPLILEEADIDLRSLTAQLVRPNLIFVRLVFLIFYFNQSSFLPMASNDSNPVARTITISVIDYYHRFRAYQASHPFPSFYYTVSMYVREWVGITNDEDWEEYIFQVRVLAPYILYSPFLISSYLGYWS
jgi:hypothetical protein